LLVSRARLARLRAHAPRRRRALHVAPVLGPLGVERAQVVAHERRLGGRMRVAAVAHALALRAVDHVTAEAEALERPQEDLEHLVEQRAAGLEARRLREVGAHETAAELPERRATREALHRHVAA